MIVPMKQSLTVRLNDNPFRVTFVVEDETGEPVDFSAGYSARLQMRLYPGAPGDPLVEALSSDVTGTLLDMHAVGIDFVLIKADIPEIEGRAPAATATISYDLLITPDGGDENAWFEGAVNIQPGVSA